MPSKSDKTELKKLNSKQVDKLKGRLVEVRRAGAGPIFVEVKAKDTVLTCLKNADVPTDDHELKIEGIKDRQKTWKKITGKEKAIEFQRLVVTTKVRGSRY